MRFYFGICSDLLLPTEIFVAGSPCSETLPLVFKKFKLWENELAGSLIFKHFKNFLSLSDLIFNSFEHLVILVRA